MTISEMSEEPKLLADNFKLRKVATEDELNEIIEFLTDVNYRKCPLISESRRQNIITRKQLYQLYESYAKLAFDQPNGVGILYFVNQQSK